MATQRFYDGQPGPEIRRELNNLEAILDGTVAAAASAKAQQWADAAPGVEVETGKYSAKHWATSATAAGSSATNAATSATVAATSASAAAASAATAATKADEASASAVVAQAASDAAQAFAGTSMWNAATNYTVGNLVVSPTNWRTYRRKTAGVSTTDPAIDSINWVPVQLGELVAVDAFGDQTDSASVLAALADSGAGGTVLLARSAILNRVPTLGMVVAAMRSGKTVKIACYGDSTTDGMTTTGHTSNPTSGGVPVGAIDHESTAPNAWPAKLKAILRKMYGNANIQVWNAGYSGRSLDDGWAMTNYDKAVTNNPAYGVPDVCFIGFGLNDMVRSDAYKNHYTQTLALCLKLIGAGTLPILLTCAPTQRNDPAVRDSEEATQEIDSAKRAVARQLSIPLFEVGAAMRQWASCNNGGYTWANAQPDDLHFRDAGHAFQAGFIAAQTYPDLIVPADGMTVAAQDPRWQLNNTLTWGKYTRSGGKVGGRSFYSNSVGAGVELMSGWVWNTDKNLDIHNLVLCGGGDPAVGSVSSFLIEDTVSGVTKTVRLSGGPMTNIQRTTDLPLTQQRVPVGLLRISAATPADAGFGSKYSSDLLFTAGRSDIGRIDGLRIPSTIVADSGNFRYYAPELARADLEVGKSCRVEVTADIPLITGFLLWHCRHFQFSTSTSYTGGGTRTGLHIFRTPAGNWNINVGGGNPTATPSLSFTVLTTIPSASVPSNADGSFTFVFELTWTAGTPRMAIKSASGTLLANVDLTNIDAPFSGWIGGLLHLTAAVSAPVLRSISWSPL